MGQLCFLFYHKKKKKKTHWRCKSAEDTLPRSSAVISHAHLLSSVMPSLNFRCLMNSLGFGGDSALVSPSAMILDDGV